MKDLEAAWNWREAQGLIAKTGALRVFHGAGEGSGSSRRIAIDRFVDAATGHAHFWITGWERGGAGVDSELAQVVDFLRARGARSVVALNRPEKGVPEIPEVLFGEVPEGRFEAVEDGARFRLELNRSRHPGLFLDHAPLRSWLRERARGWKVLNTFAYTGSLSVAAGLGGAEHVTTLDLSKATVDWAQENWRANGLADSASRFISGDVFEWLPRLKRERARYDCVILDPPSFSRGKKGTFSTAKDLRKLHELAIALVEPGGCLVTSINSESVPREKYLADVIAAARAQVAQFQVLREIDLPDTFPTRLEMPQERYLKGWILRRAR